MNLVIVCCLLLLSATHIFSMEFLDVRKVVSFQLTDAKTQQEKSLLPTTCLMTQDGDLISCETGIKYELSDEHLTVIYCDWQAINTRRSLFGDYLLQTALQQTDNNFVRIGINYDEIEPDQNDNITNFLWDKVLAKKAPQTFSKKQTCVDKPVPIARITRNIQNGTIKAFTLVDPYLPKRRYIQALLQGKKIIISGEKPYNNEGVIYYGESEMDDEIVREMQDHLRREIRHREYNPSKNLTLWYVTLALHENVGIDVLIKIEENDKGPFNFLFAREPEKEPVQQEEVDRQNKDVQIEAKVLPQGQTELSVQETNQQQQQKLTMDIVKLEKEELPVGEKITQDAQGTWPQLLWFSGGVVFCVAAFLMYRYKNA